MQEQTFNPTNIAIKYGIVIGVINMLLLTTIYYISTSLLVNMWYGIVNFTVGIAIYSFFCLKLRKVIGGYWSFREAFKGIFIMLFFSGFIYSTFSFLFFKYIETDAYMQLSTIYMDETAQMLEKTGAKQELIDETIEQGLVALKQQFQPAFKQWGQVLSISILVYFVIAAIFSLIFKKDEPIYLSKNEMD